MLEWPSSKPEKNGRATQDRRLAAGMPREDAASNRRAARRDGDEAGHAVERR